MNATVSFILNELKPLIYTTVKSEYELAFNTKTAAKNLFSSLEEIQTVLEDAGQRRLTDPRVRDWLGRLQDLVFEIDDTLDKWKTTESIRLQIQRSGGGDEAASPSCLGSIGIKRISFCSWPVNYCKHRDLASNIKKLNEMVDLLAMETSKYTLLPINYTANNNSNNYKEAYHHISTSFTNVVPLRSQEDQKKELIKDILPKERVVTLLGTVGSGKTTLAQLLFLDEQKGFTRSSHDVQNGFELKIWVSVPYTFDKFSVAKAILECLGKNYPENASLQTLLELIKSSIRRKKFLLVLDNVWQEDKNMWRQLKASLDHGSPKSRIVVTTRNENVAKMMGGITEVKGLSGDEECRSLFNEVAFRGKDEKEKEELRPFAEAIVSKCGKLPFVVKTVGDYLCSKYAKALWKNAADKEFWQIEELAEALFAPLAFSYNELPSAVKHYFSYFAMFPKDDPINVDELNRIWTLLASLSSSRTDAEMEMEGHGYFEKLNAQFFFQDVEKEGSGRCYEWFKMNGLIYNFAQYLAHSGSKVEKPRCVFSKKELSPGELRSSLSSLRVLIQKWDHERMCSETGEASQVEEPPSEIGHLIHLRYLDYSYCPIKRLPDTLCNLYNLHTVDLRHCNLSELPKGIHRLKNLRHLMVGENPELKGLPKGVGKLTALKTLDEFKVGRDEVSKFQHLENMNKLQGAMRICLSESQKAWDVKDAEEADMRSKIHLEDLQLEVWPVTGDLEETDGEHLQSVMQALLLAPYLESVRICGYRRWAFPNWIISGERKKHGNMTVMPNL